MDGLKLVICQRIFWLQRRGNHESEVEFLRLVLKHLPKKEAMQMEGKVEISLSDLVDVRVAIRSCAEALEASGGQTLVSKELREIDEALYRAMYDTKEG